MVLVGHVVGMYSHMLTSLQISVPSHSFVLVTLLARDAKGNRRASTLCLKLQEVFLHEADVCVSKYRISHNKSEYRGARRKILSSEFLIICEFANERNFASYKFIVLSIVFSGLIMVSRRSRSTYHFLLWNK